jgi:ribonuclease T1
MHAMRFVGRFLLAFLLFAPVAEAQLAPTDPQALAGFAEKSGLRDVAGFVDTVQSLRATGRLPPRYATKDEAAAHGWHGGGLCGVWPGHVIGGDIFRNFGRALPAAPGRVYREADLDADCRSRGPKRLIFSTDGLIFVTIDHYDSFTGVP